jgi:hypothetical protein
MKKAKIYYARMGEFWTKEEKYYQYFAKSLRRLRQHPLALFASLALGIGYTAPAQAQNYGARIFWLAPKDVSAVQFQVLSTQSNTSSIFRCVL